MTSEDAKRLAPAAIHSPWMKSLRGLREGGKAAAREALGEIPFAKALEALVLGSREQFIKDELDEFFSLLAEHAGNGDEADMLLLIAENCDKPHFHRAVEHGYTKMRLCIDEAAKPCIAVLAGFEIRQEYSSVFIRRAADLLADSDLDLLLWLRQVADAYSVLLHRATDPIGASHICRFVEAKPDVFWISGKSGEKWIHSDVMRCESRWHEYVARLGSHGFGTMLTGMSFLVDRDGMHGANYLDWSAGQVQWMKGLHTCLRPVVVPMLYHANDPLRR